MNRSILAAAVIAAAVFAATAVAAPPTAYNVHPLVSNGVVPTPNPPDPTLVNGWGLVSGPGTPWWVSDNGADASTLYNASGAKQALTVAVGGGPTGVVFNGTTGFPVAGAPALFIFASEDGAIRAWNRNAGTIALVTVPPAGGAYKGLTLATAATGARLYATDFVDGRVDVFDSMWQPVTTPGGFVDPSLPAGYAPFGIQAIGSQIFVTFAKQSPDVAQGDIDEVHGQSLGFVDVFDANGVLLGRVAQRGQLNAPWGLAMAPSDFGSFSGDLLVGNFGDGTINAYEPLGNGRYEHSGQLRTSDGSPVTIDGLWALEFGHGAANNGSTNTLFFTAGPNDESDGLFGSITAG